MEGQQKLAEGDVARVRGDGVKTKNGCDYVFSGPPGGVVNIIFRKTPRIWATIFFHPPQKKVRLYVDWRALTPATTLSTGALRSFAFPLAVAST